MTAASVTPAAAPPAVTLSAVRVGEHSGKTRLVIDGSDKLPFSPVIDSATNTLIVDVPGTAWQGSAGEQAIAKSPLLASWRSEPDGQGGTRIIAQLKKSSKIVLAESLGPANGQPGKIIVDLAAQ
jgi:N-acetylmuramoyl-L-alanine amidase